MRVVFCGGGTGGHLYPGLAIARALVSERPDVQPHFVGALRGIERDVLPSTGFPFTLLDAHPLYRTRPWRSWRTARGFVSGWRAMTVLSRAERPRLVVGTGGYASAIPLTWARAHGVPMVQHIGDAMPGAAARLFARWSRQCYLGFGEAEARLPGAAGRCVVTGNPVEPPPEPRPNRTSMLRAWEFEPGTRVLLVFGGSQGSRAINEVVADWVREGIPAGWSLIWATGKAMHAPFASLASTKVRVVPYLSPIADAYAVADLALVRGGMMGTAECCAWGIPMIIVPLPTAAADHQSWNARSLAAAGAAIHVPQPEFTRDRLARTVAELSGDAERLAALRHGAQRAGRPRTALDISRLIAAHLPV